MFHGLKTFSADKWLILVSVNATEKLQTLFDYTWTFFTEGIGAFDCQGMYRLIGCVYLYTIAVTILKYNHKKNYLKWKKIVKQGYGGIIKNTKTLKEHQFKNLNQTNVVVLHVYYIILLNHNRLKK